MVFSVFHFVSIASHPTSGYHWEECSCITLNCSPESNLPISVRFLWNFLSPGWTIPDLCLFSGQMCQVLNHHFVPLLDSLHYVYVSCSRDLRTGHTNSGTVSTVLSRIEHHFLQLAGSTLHNATQKTTGLPHLKGIMLTHGQQADPRFFSAELSSSWSAPIRY